MTLDDNRIAGDTLTANNIAADFDNKNAGTGKTVTITGINIAGVDAGNYTFNTEATTTADITPAPLTITPDLKVGSVEAGVVLEETQFTAEGLVSGESISSVTLTTAGAGPGVFAVNASAPIGSGFDPDNYDITFIPGVLVLVPTSSLIYDRDDRSQDYNRTIGSLLPAVQGTISADDALSQDSDESESSDDAAGDKANEDSEGESDDVFLEQSIRVTSANP